MEKEREDGNNDFMKFLVFCYRVAVLYYLEQILYFLKMIYIK